MKKIISLMISGMMMLSMVGCGSNYKVENKEMYTKGYYKYAVADGIDSINNDYKFYAVIYNTVDWIQCDNVGDEEVKDLDFNYLYTVKIEDLDDYEYGMLQFAIDRTKEEKEKDLYYIYENGAGVILGDISEESEKIIKKYNDAYVECYNELLELLNEIKDKYGKEDIDWDYLDRVNEIREKQENILDSYANEILSVNGAKIMQNIFD